MAKKKDSKKVEEVNVADNESEVIEEVEAFVCPSCGAEVADDTITCPGCGAFFDYEDGTEVPDSPDEDTPPLPSYPEDDMDPPADPEDKSPKASNPVPQSQGNPTPYVVRDSEMRIASALKEYTVKRRKRYLSGALFTGLGILFFVILWLFTVHQVWVEEADTIFGLEVILLLAIASVLFIMGMYLILTYPKSSLMDVFSTMPRAEPK
jgi:YgiT-type zinc finger domain-containing protein